MRRDLRVGGTVAALLLAGCAGILRSHPVLWFEAGDCADAAIAGPVHLQARSLGRVGEGRVPLRIADASCGDRDVVAIWQAGPVPPGRRIDVEGFWRTTETGRPATLVVRAASVRSEDGRAPLLRMRGYLLELTSTAFGDSAPLIDAVLLARREGLAFDTSRAFARSGVAHLLAISGFHVGVVATLFFMLTLPLSLTPAQRPLVTAGGVGLYLALIGFPRAATRAGIFLLALAIARWRGRPAQTQAVLSTALLALLTVEPSWLFSPGLQLSFAGVLGLTLWRHPVADVLARWRVPEALRAPLSASLAASAATAPLVGWHFGEVSWIGVGLSVVLTPWVALVIVGGLSTLAVSALVPAWGPFLGVPTAWAAQHLVRVVEVVAQLPWVSVDVTQPVLLAVVAGAVVGSRLAGAAQAHVRILVIVGCATATPGLLPVTATLRGAGRLEIVALDVGQGDAIAIRTPRDRWVLIDTGGRTERWDAGRDRVVPFLRRRGVRQLDLLVLTHADLDHTGGAPSVLEAFPPRRVIDPGVAVASHPFRELLANAERQGIHWTSAQAGQRLDLDGVMFTVLSPDSARGSEDVNDGSVVLLLRYGAFEALFTGDASRHVENQLLSGPLPPVELLKVGHHGSSTSTGAAFLERLQPELAVIPVGARNRYGHPDPEVLSRLETAGARILRTDQHGDIRILAERDGRWRVPENPGR